MLILSAHMCMAINLYKECRGTSDKECQLINRVVINRMNTNQETACSVIFAKNQFSWTKRTPEKLEFKNYNDMMKYYKINDTAQLSRAFDNVDNSMDDSNFTLTSNMLHYYDRSLRHKPKWAKHMETAAKTRNFVFCNA